MKEFKSFILKGNVVDLSTGVIIGAAFAEGLGVLAIVLGILSLVL